MSTPNPAGEHRQPGEEPGAGPAPAPGQYPARREASLKTGSGRGGSPKAGGCDDAAWPLLPVDGEALLQRFTRYAAIHTTSDHHSETSPSTPGQWDLARILVEELQDLGLADVQLSDSCYVSARLPARLPPGKICKSLALIAHMDTSPDCSGEDVRVLVHRAWDGSPVTLPGGPVLDPALDAGLARHVGKDLVTSDGTTLLGADDKAGVAEIMTALAWLRDHDDFDHPEIEVVFTPDEEIGRGTSALPPGIPRSRYAFTLDGEDEGTYNIKCFNGWTVEVVFTGRMMHPGMARGRLVNPVTMAAAFVSNLPRSESPEATDQDYGFYCPQELNATMESATLTLFIRDFDLEGINRRLDFLRMNAALVQASFPGGRVTVTERKQYLNMEPAIQAEKWLGEVLVQAFEKAGLDARAEGIRGGTDGARLTEMGVLTPNIFAGGHNFHSLGEWVPLQSMEAAVRVILHLAEAWATRTETA